MSGYDHYTAQLRRLHAQASKMVGKEVVIKVGGHSGEPAIVTDYTVQDGEIKYTVSRAGGMPGGPYKAYQIEAANVGA